jgi:hypothetical protein
MRPELNAAAAGQGGLFRRQDAIACGYTEREMRTCTGHGGEWVTVRRGVYVERTLWESLDEDGRYGLKVRAAHLNLRTDAVLSHHSAAVVWKMPLRPRWRDLVHVTRPGVTGGRTEHGVKHHPAGYRPAEVTVRHGLRVTGLARTAVDIGRESGFEDGVVACDAALRLGATHEELEEVLAPMTSWPHVARARAAVAVADQGAATIGESLTRLLVSELGIGVPETQFEVLDQGWRAVADLRVGRHLFEFDGKVKYVGRDRGGVADRPAEEVLWQEKRREDRLRSLGYGVSRVVWAELFGVRRQQAKSRLAGEYLQTLRRYQRAG